MWTPRGVTTWAAGVSTELVFEMRWWEALLAGTPHKARPQVRQVLGLGLSGALAAWEVSGLAVGSCQRSENRKACVMIGPSAE